MPMHDTVPSPPSQSIHEAIRPERLDSNRFIHVSPSSRKLILQAELVAPHLRLATIEGESGSGKQTLARFLYRRAAAVNPNLAPSGFKHYDAREWLLSETDSLSTDGFIFLDRVDLLAGPGQNLLLRILKNLETLPSGKVVLVASSESSLRSLAAKGRFVPDLAFRLTTIRLATPPLRERREDIVPLSALFLDEIRLRYHAPGFTLTPSAISRFLEHDWPGNVRELAGVLESAVLESSDGVIRAEDLSINSTPALIERPGKPPSLNLDTVIQNHLRYVLSLNHGNKLKTARQLGISRSTLYRMLDIGRHLTA